MPLILRLVKWEGDSPGLFLLACPQSTTVTPNLLFRPVTSRDCLCPPALCRDSEFLCPCLHPASSPPHPQQFTGTTAGFPFSSEVSVNQESPGSVQSWLLYSEGKAGQAGQALLAGSELRTWVGEAGLGTRPGVDGWGWEIRMAM